MTSYDVVVTGAGMSGVYQLHRLRGLGMRVRVPLRPWRRRAR